jgi:hypothetical protein
MKDEVEDFLRRVAQMRAQAEAQAKAQQQRLVQPQQPQPQQPQFPQPQVPQPQQRMMPPARFPPQPQPGASPFAPSPFAQQRQEIVYLEPAEVEVVDAEVAELGDNVSRHVAQHLRGPQQIAEHARQLGEEVDLADDKLEARLHQTFDHKLGQLKKTASTTAATPHVAPSPDVTASELISMLRSPESIRDAFVMSEIFRRPDERW